jgi:hypothetical protein
MKQFSSSLILQSISIPTSNLNAPWGFFKLDASIKTDVIVGEIQIS